MKNAFPGSHENPRSTVNPFSVEGRGISNMDSHTMMSLVQGSSNFIFLFSFLTSFLESEVTTHGQ